MAFHDYLKETLDSSRLHIEVLKDSDATRLTIIEQLRSHLGQAKADDVAVFQYCVGRPAPSAIALTEAERL